MFVGTEALEKRKIFYTRQRLRLCIFFSIIKLMIEYFSSSFLNLLKFLLSINYARLYFRVFTGLKGIKVNGVKSSGAL